MKIKIFLSVTIMIVVAVAVVYQEFDRKAVNRVSAQINGGCNNYLSDFEACGNTETCGLGEYEISAAFPMVLG